MWCRAGCYENVQRDPSHRVTRLLLWTRERKCCYGRGAYQANDDLVFADPVNAGRPLSERANLRRYRHALRAARLDETHTIHDLRHTFGTRMAAANTPMRTLQEWMGHRHVTTTQRYADYAPALTT